MRGLNELAIKAYSASKEKGFYDSPVETGTRLMLIVSEVSEALEAHRKDKHTTCNLRSVMDQDDDEFQYDFKNAIKDTFEDEIADAFIRLFDLCGYMDIDIEKHIELKMRYNSLRPHKHGKKY